MRAIGLGRIVERHPPIERGTDDAVHLGARGDGGLVGAAHVLHAQPDAGNLQRSERAAAVHFLRGSCGGGVCRGRGQRAGQRQRRQRSGALQKGAALGIGG